VSRGGGLFNCVSVTMVGRPEKQTFGVGRELFGRPTMPTRFASLMQTL
jgi:hypothetical protein